MDYLRRHIEPRILEAASDSPVVMLIGARQTGKSTVAQSFIDGKLDGSYYTLDEATTLYAAQSDPAGFVAGLGRHTVVDEIQRVPELLLAMKAAVDRDRQPGRFLLTGSADVLVLPRVSESLAGRMEILTLWPFSQGELNNAPDRFVDALFRSDFDPVYEPVTHDDLARRIVSGGYPEIQRRTRPGRRRAWFEAYVTSILQRDVRDIANIEGLTEMPRLLAILSARSGTLLNYAELSRSAGMPQTTLKRYVTLLHQTFLVHDVPAWSGNTSKRLVKSPKSYMCDTGLACHLAGADEDYLLDQRSELGRLLETLVAAELKKQIEWSDTDAALYHFRTQAGAEVDFVLEDRKGRVVGIEVKAGATIRDRDTSGLNALAQTIGRKYLRGIILYLGRQRVNFSPKMAAVPLPALWMTA